jgi:hypothetical protein
MGVLVALVLVEVVDVGPVLVVRTVLVDIDPVPVPETNTGAAQGSQVPGVVKL